MPVRYLPTKNGEAPNQRFECLLAFSGDLALYLNAKKNETYSLYRYMDDMLYHNIRHRLWR